METKSSGLSFSPFQATRLLSPQELVKQKSDWIWAEMWNTSIYQSNKSRHFRLRRTYKISLRKNWDQRKTQKSPKQGPLRVTSSKKEGPERDLIWRHTDGWGLWLLELQKFSTTSRKFFCLKAWCSGWYQLLSGGE